MSCPLEPALLLYAEAELSGPELHELESHLVGCRDCRARVLALRDESRLLGDVLQERGRARARAAEPARAPEPGVALGLPLAVAAVTAALAFLGILLESRVPGGFDLLNPLRLKGAYEMAFDLVFWLQENAPGAVELAASVGVIAAVSAILTFAVGALYRHVYGAAAVLLLAFLGSVPQPAEGLVMRFDQDTQVTASEVIGESMLLTGELVHVDGVVEGNLIVSAKRLTIGGTVKGSVYALSRDVEITGTIEGNLHGLIEHTRIDGDVRGDVFEVGESVTLAPGGVVGRDLSMLAEDGIVGGRVGRDVFFGGEKLELRSEVGRHVQSPWAEGVALRDGARIGGDVNLGLRSEEQLERAPGAEVAGEVDVSPLDGMKEHYLDMYRDPGFWLLHGIMMVAAFVFGLLLRLLVPVIFEGELTTSPEFFRSLGYGLAVIVVTPLAIVALALTVVGIPVAVLTLFTYIVLFYSAEIVASAWIGRLLWAPTDESLFAFGRSFFVGLAALTVTSHIPFVGLPIAIVATLIGAGLMFEQWRNVALPRLTEARAW